MPLIGIPFIISPDLLHALSSAGHGDEIVLADAHFPVTSICKEYRAKEIRADGHKIADLLEAILKLFPLDTYVPYPGIVMEVVKGDPSFPPGVEPAVWKTYNDIIAEIANQPESNNNSNTAASKWQALSKLERYEFYDRAKKAFAIIATGETSQYGNIIIKKGIVKPDQ